VIGPAIRSDSFTRDGRCALYFQFHRWRMQQRVVNQAAMYGLFHAFAMLFAQAAGTSTSILKLSSRADFLLFPP